MLKNKLIAQQTVSQTRCFSRSCLPLTMVLADQYKKDILPILDEKTKTIPFHDRVLFLLMPSMEHEIVMFYADQGSSLEGLFDKNEIQGFDKELRDQLNGFINHIRSSYE